MKQLLALTLLITSASLSAYSLAEYCAESKIIEKEFDAKKFTSVELRALAGSLEVTASEDHTIHFWGKVCTDSVKHMDMMELLFSKEDVSGENASEGDDELVLKVVIPYHQDDFDPSYASMDIELRVPVALQTHLKDSSGDILIQGVSVATLEDSSGNIRIDSSLSDLSIRDSSGDITIRGMLGNLTVSDSSGDIDLRDINGDVRVPGDSSGEIEIKGVTGSVVIDRDGSGSISIAKVGKNVSIGLDGSGDIEIEDVDGTVQIDSDGSGGVSVEQVAGDFRLLNKGSGEIKTYAIKGTIDTPDN